MRSQWFEMIRRLFVVVFRFAIVELRMYYKHGIDVVVCASVLNNKLIHIVWRINTL